MLIDIALPCAALPMNLCCSTNEGKDYSTELEGIVEGMGVHMWDNLDMEDKEAQDIGEWVDTKSRDTVELGEAYLGKDDMEEHKKPGVAGMSYSWVGTFVEVGEPFHMLGKVS